MTTEADRREQERAARIAQELEGQRRLAMPEDYLYDKSQDAFWDQATATLHDDRSVDASIPQERWRVVMEEPAEVPAGAGRPPRVRERLIPPSRDIMRVEADQFVEGSTWWPGKGEILRDVFVDASGPRDMRGCRMYNLYRDPPRFAATKVSAERWVEHVKRLWPDEGEHEYFFNYCAHMLQFPSVKANTAIVLSGAQGIGKDAALYPVREAVGSWNVKNVDPDDLFSTFRPWLQTLMLVVNEVRPTKDEFHASSMYNIMKPLIAAPPDTLPLNDKHKQLRYIVNVMRVFMTTNDYMAMYIPPEDRRMFVMHSKLAPKWHEAAGNAAYFEELFTWFNDGGGVAAVAAWLMARDIRDFKPKSTPVKTAGWNAVAGTWEEPDDGVLFALEQLGHPDVLFGTELADPQFDCYEEVVAMLKSPRKIGHRMQRAGYMLVKCQDGERWIFRSGGATFRVRLAFVKQSSGLLNGNLMAALAERGKLIAARMATKPSTPHDMEPRGVPRH